MSFYLVTGGAGFIGSNIVEELLRRGETVRVIDNFVTGKEENIAEFLDRIEVLRGDIRDMGTVKNAVKGVDYVLHQAALRSVPRSVDDPVATNESNVTGTLNILMAARDGGVKRVVYASSSSVYGDAPDLPKREDHLPSPISPYAVSKLTGEYYCTVFSKIFGLQTVSLRYFNVFGPNQDPESKYAAVVPLFIRMGMSDKELEVHGDGLQSRDFTYVANVVAANLLAARAENVSGKVFNIAGGERYTVLDIARLVGRFLDKKLQWRHTPPRKGDVRHTMADIGKAQRILGYEVKVGFEEGMKRTVDFFKTRT